MSDNSKIEWTDATWNPVRGLHEDQPRLQALLCRDVRRAISRRAGASVRAGLRPAAGAREAARAAPLDEPKMIFVNSMSDLFHEDVPDEYIELCVEGDAAANWHTYQVLTKRSERLRRFAQDQSWQCGASSRTSGGASASRTETRPASDRASPGAPAAMRFCRSSRCWKTSAIRPGRESIG